MGEEESWDAAAEPAGEPEHLEIDLYPELVAFSEEPESKRTALGAAPPSAAPAEERPQHPAGHPVAPPTPPPSPNTRPAPSTSVPQLTPPNNGNRGAAGQSRTQISGSTCSECGKEFHGEELFCPVCGAFTG